jgi:hypothetical protein
MASASTSTTGADAAERVRGCDSKLSRNFDFVSLSSLNRWVMDPKNCVSKEAKSSSFEAMAFD